MEQDDTLYAALGEEIFWQYTQNLYRQLKENDSLVAPGSMEEWFVLSVDTAPIGLLYAAEKAIHALMTPDSAYAAQLSDFEEYRRALMDSMYIYEESAADTTHGSETITLFASLSDSIKNVISDAEKTFVNEYIIAFDEQRNAAADSVATALEQITTSVPIEQWHRDINIVYLNTVAKNIDTFSTEQWSTVTSIAYQCIEKGGEATALARSLYQNIMGSVYFDDSANCNQSYKKEQELTPLQKRAEKPELQFVLYPNPTNGKAYLACNVAINRKCEVIMVNMLGQQVILSNISMEKGLLEIDTKNLASGLYNIKVVTQSEPLYSGKLSLVR